MQSFPMGRSAGPSLFHGGLSEFRQDPSDCGIGYDREYYASIQRAKMFSFPPRAFLTPSIQEYHIRNCLTSRNHTHLRIAA
ncbi:hypothetical protein [Leptospira borgpetersenii]|uniref:hypothetical protein n=2 Tax=Leptospira borgpetersenii TaxID=174 RepID=UPI00138F29EC|nr:hypothetical protein [Leptospira borgpetersenii]MBE8161412.1 hypothetical protein [Leptospira borgpetersenii serovar Ballum]MBE8165816.1 hypothetical protein [Leptospira borgpetersenii serovar Ballum]MBE8171217.1 hypothetical protein [Leptospira borgpetersenii serovar Ballum]MBE8174369.1 hypothetical protein [Leptospira borgpetersenii serovar Ballum]MBE8177678.1 hypothetical protein [Leptospira borgpetersenii serovar Ballum]